MYGELYTNVQKLEPYVLVHKFLPNPSDNTRSLVIRQNSAALRNFTQKEKSVTLELSKPFLDPKAKVITPINKPFVQILSDQENSSGCKQHSDKQVQGYLPMLVQM